MPSTIDKTVNGFWFLSISPMVGVPDYKQIAKVHLHLNSNTESVYSNLGDGALGLL